MFKSMIITKWVPIVLLFCIAFVCYAVPVALRGDIWLSVEDEIANFLTTTELINKGTIFVKDINFTYNEQFNTSAFGKKHMCYMPGRGMLSQYPFGLPLLLAPLAIIMRNIKFVMPFIGALGVVGFYILNFLYFKKSTQAFVAAVLLLVMPGYWYWSTFVFAEIPSIFLFILALIFLELFFSKKNIWLFAIAGFLLGFNVMVKYTNILLFIPVGIYLLFRRKDLKTDSQAIFIAFLAAIVPIVCLMIFHYQVFGNPLMTGYHYYGAQVYETLNTTHIAGLDKLPMKGNLVPMKSNLTALFKHILGFPLQFSVMLPYALLSICAGFVFIRKHLALGSFIMATLLLMFIFHANIGGTAGYESEEMTMHSSYLRYLLIAFTMLIIPVAYYVSSLSHSRWLFTTVLFILIFASVSNNISSIPRHNLRLHQKKLVPANQSTRNFLLRNTPTDSVIVAYGQNKYVLADRPTIVTSKISAEQLLLIAERLLSSGKQLFYVPDEDNKYEFLFREYGQTQLIEEDTLRMYKILSLDENWKTIL